MRRQAGACTIERGRAGEASAQLGSKFIVVGPFAIVLAVLDTSEPRPRTRAPECTYPRIATVGPPARTRSPGYARAAAAKPTAANTLAIGTIASATPSP